MSAQRKPINDDEAGLGHDPLALDDPLADTFYSARPAAKKRGRPRGGGRRPLPAGRSFRLVTFSFYEDDVARLDALLAEAKKRGHRRVSRSQIVRLALRQVDVSRLPEIV